MASLSQLLLDAQASTADVRNAAVQLLQKQKVEHSAMFLRGLAAELSNESDPKIARQLAGLLLKNTLKNANREDAISGLWGRVPVTEKAEVKKHTLGSLASADKDVRQSAAQAVAAIAGIELPVGEWTDLISILITNANGDNVNFRQSSLMTLGYILEEVEPSQLNKAISDQILTALASNILVEQVPQEVKLEAMKALGHALQFSSANFKNESERGHIMKMVLLGCQNSNEEIRLAAFQDLCEVALLYYDYIATHLPDLWNVTSAAIQRGGQKVGTLAMEFWNIIADIEKDRKDHPRASKSMRNFICTASASLLPLLFEGVLQCEEDNDEWTLFKSCGSNLLSVVQLTGNPIVDPCVQFISQHLTSTNWQHRHAAILVIGSVLEGPTSQKLAPVIADGYTALLTVLKDRVLQVRVTSAWTLSRMCEFHFQQLAVHPSATLLLSALVDALRDDGKVAAHACTAVVHVVTSSSTASLFSPESFELLYTVLMQTAYRTNVSDSTLQIAAFNALETLIEKSESGFQALLEAKLPLLVKALKESVGVQGADNVQARLCSILATTFRRIRPAVVSDDLVRELVETLLGLFRVRATVVEEGIHTFGALAQLIKDRIVPWISSFGPSLAYATGKQDDSSLCKSGTMVIGDLARALEGHIVGYLADLVPLLISNLQSSTVSTDIKIQSIGSIGDLAQAAKGAFLQYIPQVMIFIETAADSSLQLVKEEDSDLFEYLQELREVIVQFYIGLLQGLYEGQQAEVMLQYIPKVVQYAFLTTQEQYKPTVSIHMNTLGLVGDIALAYGARAKGIVCNPAIINYINWQAAGTNARVKELARWTLGHISSLNSL